MGEGMASGQGLMPIVYLRWDVTLKGRSSTEGRPRGQECPRHKETNRVQGDA